MDPMHAPSDAVDRILGRRDAIAASLDDPQDKAAVCAFLAWRAFIFAAHGYATAVGGRTTEKHRCADLMRDVIRHQGPLILGQIIAFSEAVGTLIKGSDAFLSDWYEDDRYPWTPDDANNRRRDLSRLRDLTKRVGLRPATLQRESEHLAVSLAFEARMVRHAVIGHPFIRSSHAEFLEISKSFDVLISAFARAAGRLPR